jgi:prenyltransferase beta subunit
LPSLLTGIDVPVKLLNDSVNYLVKCQNADGGIRYSIHSGQTSSVMKLKHRDWVPSP